MFNDSPIAEFRGPWGVPVQIGASFLILPLIFVSFTGSPMAIYYDLIFLALILLAIFLHEMGHAWGCLIQGIGVRRVMIYGGGGFCEHARSGTPREEELIVAMGPIVNLALWAMSGLILPAMPAGDIAWAVETFGYINLFLAVFNLLPVMPLDGGKLFHLMLLRLLPAGPAMQIAGGVGLILALVWIPLMLLSYFTLGLVLFFIPPLGLHWRMLRREIA